MRTLLGLVLAVDSPFAFEEWFSFLQEADPTGLQRTTVSGLLNAYASQGGTD